MYNFKEIEEEAKKIWKLKEKEIKKALKDDKKKKIFSFLEGPPTANAPPGIHHLEVRTYKDVICRFKFMNGFSVPRKGGWDCHGLPVEVQVEKKLGLKTKKEVLNYGIKNFVEKCRQDVFSYIKEWERSTKELAYMIDLDNPYITLDNDYIESVWWSLKELYKKKMLYEGRKVVQFCPRCETPLSSHEVSIGYRDVSEESVYVFFEILGKRKEYFLVWTTTPWTLPGNVALAVGKDIEYVKIMLENGNILILSKERLNVIKEPYKIIQEMKGRDLLGIKYSPIFDIAELKNENSHKVIPAEFVTTEDGTGIVHIAVMYGEEDYEVGLKENLPAVHIIGQDGRFLDLVPKFSGRFVKDAEKEIINELKEMGLLYKTENIVHSYPFCWRCDTPLLYYAVNSWFIAVSKVRDKLVKINEKINWEPKHIKYGRFGNWLESSKDWALSRFKFFGTPLPIWECSKCGERRIIGSIKEIKKYSLKKIKDNKIDLHRPWIDDIKLKCKCNGEMSRLPDVIDCWYDSGAASFAQFHYPFENKREFKRRFPYDYIAEAIDQTRGWFYTLHVLSTILFNKPAYKNVICAGHVVDEKGEKMSKSKGNVINPDEMINKVGVDAIRAQFCITDAGSTKRFSYNLVKESVLPFLIILYNTNKYYLQMEDRRLKRERIEDKWILSRLNSLIRDVTENLNNFLIDVAFQKIINFVVNDFSRTYIKITRNREDNKEVVKEILKKVSLILAPFIPHITEFIYKNFSKQSVHLSKWPKPDSRRISPRLEGRFNTVIKIIERGLAERDKAGINLRWPLYKAIIHAPKEEKVEEFRDIILSQLNIKDFELRELGDNKNIEVHFDTTLTPELEAEGYSREISRKIQELRKSSGLNKKDKIKLFIFTEEGFRAILEENKDFIKSRTNAVDIKILVDKPPEKNFKNMLEFNINGKKGAIGIIAIKK
ncbi:MAG: isoleucine--tRNA ligase [Candidatus Pacearchaeota archaeon]